MSSMSAAKMADKIIDYLEENRYPKKDTQKIWKILFKDFEEFPENPREAIEIINEEIVSTSAATLHKICKKILEEDYDE